MKTRAVLDTLHEYTPGHRIAGAVKLSSNENPLGPSPLALDAARTALINAHIYPDGGYPDLRSAVADRLGISPRQVLPTNGSDEALTLIAAAYIEPGDRVLIPVHTFSQYEFSARLFGATIDRVPMRDLAIDLDATEHAAGVDTRAIYLCSPNNPTGLILEHERLVRFLDRVSPSTLVVVDHAYIDYAFDDSAANAIALIGRYRNLVVLRTFSKLYGLAAMRVGYAVACEERIAEIGRTRSPFNVNSIAAAAAVASLEDTAFADSSLDMNRRGRERMESIYRSLGMQWLPTQANFHAVRAPGGDAAAVAEATANGGVTIRALGSFGMPEWLRITIGTGEQIDRLESLLAAFADRRG